MDWILFLHIFTIINKVLLFPLFFFRKHNSMANRMLALLILLPVFPIVSNYIFYQGPSVYFVPSLFISQIIFSFFGPVYLFYCLQMIGKPFKIDKKKLFHLLPSFSVAVLFICYLLAGNKTQLAFEQSFYNGNYRAWPMLVSSLVPITIVLIYVAASAHMVFKHIALYKEVFSNLESLRIGYIFEFNIIIIAEIVLLILLSTFVSFYYIDLVWIPLLGNIMYLYIVYKSYNYGMIFSEDEYRLFQEKYTPLNHYHQQKEKYSNSNLSAAKIEEYAIQVLTFFDEEKCYLDPDLNLSVLANRIQIPSHALSQVINQKFGKNFFDFVNAYRTDAFKEKLLDKQFMHIKLEELAYMCGFNSKASFQRAFKKYTGMTPSTYRELELRHIA